VIEPATAHHPQPAGLDWSSTSAATPLVAPAVATVPHALNECGEIIRWKSLDICEKLGEGRRGIVFAASLDGVELAAKAYNGRKRAIQRLAGIWNEAASEHFQMVRAREDFPQLVHQLQAPYGWITHPTLGPVLLSQLVRDYNDRISPPIKNTPALTRGCAALVLHLLDQIAASNRILRPNSGNILLRTVAPGMMEPVLIDFQNYDAALHFPLLGMQLALGMRSREEITRRWIKRFEERELKPRCSTDLTL